jgi:serine/threonine protein kinase
VIRFYDEFVDDEMLHIVMEYAPFGTLKQNLAKMHGFIPESSVAWILFNIISGLDFLHQQKILHRDVKSDNIFIGHNHVPKVGDFGVAKRLNSAQPMAVSVVGTPLYLSPELCNGEPYNTKSDIWAFGVLVYEVCSKGRLPFAAGNQGAVIKKILMGHYTPLSQQYSADVHTMLSECLSQKPSSRPSARALYKRLAAYSNKHEAQVHTKHETKHEIGLRDAKEALEPGEHHSAHKTQVSMQASSSTLDHWTLASPAVLQRREEKQGEKKTGVQPHKLRQQQPLWWEWASNQGFVSGKFRTLYGGTPHASPTLHKRPHLPSPLPPRDHHHHHQHHHHQHQQQQQQQQHQQPHGRRGGKGLLLRQSLGCDGEVEVQEASQHGGRRRRDMMRLLARCLLSSHPLACCEARASYGKQAGLLQVASTSASHPQRSLPLSHPTPPSRGAGSGRRRRLRPQHHRCRAAPPRSSAARGQVPAPTCSSRQAAAAPAPAGRCWR